MDDALINAAFTGIPAGGGGYDLALALRLNEFPAEWQVWEAVARRINELQQIVAQNALVALPDDDLSDLEASLR